MSFKANFNANLLYHFVSLFYAITQIVYIEYLNNVHVLSFSSQMDSKVHFNMQNTTGFNYDLFPIYIIDSLDRMCGLVAMQTLYSKY